VPGATSCDTTCATQARRVFVNSAPHYTEQHVVADGATDLLVRTFGDRIGRPARSAVGVAGLPLGFAVEIEAIVEAAS
jgi:enamine deaminase RidA (YjgF/YER057c/UK114 family)